MDIMTKFLWAAMLFIGLSALVWFARRPLRRARRSPDGRAIVVPDSAPRGTPYPYVFVNEDGSVRELHMVEKQHLETPFYLGDPRRPQIKVRYDDRNVHGGLAGYCRRSALPQPIDLGYPLPLRSRTGLRLRFSTSPEADG